MKEVYYADLLEVLEDETLDEVIMTYEREPINEFATRSIVRTKKGQETQDYVYELPESNWVAAQLMAQVRTKIQELREKGVKVYD